MFCTPTWTLPDRCIVFPPICGDGQSRHAQRIRQRPVPHPVFSRESQSTLRKGVRTNYKTERSGGPTAQDEEESDDHVFRDSLNRECVAVILAGGSGSPENPLSSSRSLAAMEVGGTIKLIDIVIGNCMQSGIIKMFVLTQYNSFMLNSHLATCYPPVVISNPAKQGFVDVLACHQTMQGTGWYRGSADAVRQNMPTILDITTLGEEPRDVLVLSGHAVYDMDFADILRHHREKDADITIATTKAGWERAPKLGLVYADPTTGEIQSFKEKPSQAELEQFMLTIDRPTSDVMRPFTASMGVYVFKRQALLDLLHSNEKWMQMDTGPDVQFGKDVIPHALSDGLKVVAFQFDGFWQDVNSLKDCLDVNLLLTAPNPKISVLQLCSSKRVGTVLPPTRWGKDAMVTESLFGEGCIIKSANIQRSVVGCNAYVEDGVFMDRSMILSNTFYTNEPGIAAARAAGDPVIGVGAGTVMKSCVVESDVSIGRNCIITPEAITDANDIPCDGKPYKVQNGIIFIQRGAVIPDNTTIP